MMRADKQWTQKTRFHKRKRRSGEKVLELLPESPCWLPSLEKWLSKPTPSPLTSPTLSLKSSSKEPREHVKKGRSSSTPAPALHVLIFPQFIENSYTQLIIPNPFSGRGCQPFSQDSFHSLPTFHSVDMGLSIVKA